MIFKYMDTIPKVLTPQSGFHLGFFAWGGGGGGGGEIVCKDQLCVKRMQSFFEYQSPMHERT